MTDRVFGMCMSHSGCMVGKVLSIKRQQKIMCPNHNHNPKQSQQSQCYGKYLFSVSVCYSAHALFM